MEDERGMVSAEMAMWSVLVAFAVAFVIWAGLQGLTQMRCREAASQAARLDARGDAASVAALEQRYRELRFMREQSKGLARVEVRGVGPALGWVPGLEVKADAVVDLEGA